MRQMILVGFLQAQNCTNHPSSWRHPASRTDSWSPDFYRHIGRVLEEGKFHLGFFDDRLSMPDMYGRNHAHTVAHGIRCVKLDAVTVLTVMGMATERLGLGATYSTSYYEPFHVARLFATLDLMTPAARPGTSSPRSTTAKRRTWAATKRSIMTSATTGPMSSWRSCSAIGTPGRTMPSSRTRRPAYLPSPKRCIASIIEGRYFRSRGPFTVPRSAQGPSGHHPGRSQRPRPKLRRAMGRGDLRRLSKRRDRPARIRGLQG